MKSEINGVKVIEFPKFADDRGYFYESYNIEKFNILGIRETFVQDNLSYSKKGVVRGMHGQYDKPQAKLIRAIKGRIYDVAFDIRPNSPTFMKYFGIELSEENGLALFVPHGCLHGFSALSEEAYVSYKVTNVYNKNGEFGVNPLDSDLKINWKCDEIITSHRDTDAPYLKEFLNSTKFKEISKTF